MFRLVETRATGNYFAFQQNGPFHLDETMPVAGNFASFLNTEMQVNRVETGLFQTDLTNNDDFLVALLSLLLLLIFQSILSTLLLRKSATGTLSSFAFSISQFVHMLRDFRFQQSVRGRGPIAGRAPVNSRVAIMAILVMSFSFGFEFLILFLTSPVSVSVTNEMASLELEQPVIPRWDDIHHTRAATTAPCSVVFLSGVEQRGTRITACLLSNLDSQPFLPVASDVAEKELVITSDLHDYGAKHTVTFGEVTANYSAVAFYTLDDIKGRVISERNVQFSRFRTMEFVHKTLIGFTLSAYNEDTGKAQFTAQMLNKLNITHSQSNGPNIEVIKINNMEKFVRVVSDRFVTRVKIPDIGTGPVLSFARGGFKSMIAVKVAGPDTKDLLMGSGSRTETKAVLWYENSRTINWLTLVIISVCGLIVLVGLRTSIHSVSSVDIAGVFVKQLVGAQGGRSPIELANDEDKRFMIEYDTDDQGPHSVASSRDEDKWLSVAKTHASPIRRSMGTTSASEPYSSHVERERSHSWT